PATALGSNQHSREDDAGEKSERPKEEGKGGVGTTSGRQQKPQHHDDTRDAPRYCPGQSHSDRPANAASPVRHDCLPTFNLRYAINGNAKGAIMRIHLTIAALVCAAASPAIAQSPVNTNPVGTWRGTSTCLVRPS